MILEKYSFGVGDRFAHQGKAQLAAIMKANQDGIPVVPVWNKSNREHTTIKTVPTSVRVEAEAAVQALDWQGSYHVDADHIRMKNVDLFVDASDFFTLDVADFMGSSASTNELQVFIGYCEKYIGELSIPGITETFTITREGISVIARKVLLAVKEAGKLYRHLLEKKGEGNFITEVSMDETDDAQTPVELFFILAAIAAEGIPAQTIAPKFTGRFNKGVDYVGEVAQFTKEFEEDLAVIAYAIKEFGLPENLKLSVHSGSDKFSIYGPMRDAISKRGAGLHVKTAGTTWLEELIGLALGGGKGLEIAQEVYRKALERFDELCKPYATVIDIDPKKLPTPETVDGWNGQQYAAALRHDQDCAEYNPNFRQLLHVGYKIAAEMGEGYYAALRQYEEVIAENVIANIYERHLKRIFPAE
ncbi:MAG: hypothetical protein JXA52_00745 [Planctomycetes bacterium]|nr:hypothetical protein [Planctomycetota bacterium]